MQVMIRPARGGDWPQMRQVFLRARQQAFHWVESGRFRLRDLDAQTRGEQLWVAVDPSQQVLGFIALWLPTSFIHHLYVDPACLRQGVGRRLLQALPDWGRSRYTLKCLSRNTPALVFYASQGFTEVGQGETSDGEHFLLVSPLD
jgi:GNAT superfamily N-acetyltransferase